MPTNVLIAGSGPAALEAALRLQRVAGARVATTLLTPETDFTYRPLRVLESFAAGTAWTYPLARIAADAGFAHHRGALARVDAPARAVETTAGERLGYDALLIATGAVATHPFAGVTTFGGSPHDAEALHGLIQDVEGGYVRRVAFVVPDEASWALPLYELALMLAERAFEMGVALESHFVTPEAAPLELFGPRVAEEVADLLRAAGIALHVRTRVDAVARGRLRIGGEERDLGRVVTLPRLQGPEIEGLPADDGGFLVTDAHGRVAGVRDVYAAGDITAFPVKQGGIACQQADAAAEWIAAAAGAPLRPEPFSPQLLGLLLTEHWARLLDREPGRTPAKLAGRELAPYLERLDAELGRAAPAGVRAA
jgi:sulfide:quinone oxidoreductase